MSKKYSISAKRRRQNPENVDLQAQAQFTAAHRDHSFHHPLKILLLFLMVIATIFWFVGAL